ncbi:MAG TPA: hypothetical protein ENJ37_03160 [Deltaproteobacteria bacterium]|nr:hypothetical protein [Deltaproteobacteria bacterium]
MSAGGGGAGGRRIGQAATAALVVVTALVSLQLVDTRFTYMSWADHGQYLILAKALATGRGYSDIHMPGAPPHTQLPPLLPLVLSPVYHLLGFNFLAMRLVIIAFGVGAVAAVKRIFDRLGAPPLGALTALLVVTNLNVLMYMGELLTEIPYLFFSMTALLLLEGGAARGGPAGRQRIAAAAVLAAAACLTRSIGAALVAGSAAAGAAAALGARPGARRAVIADTTLFVVVSTLPFLAWTARNSLMDRGVASYQSIFFCVDYYDLDKGTIGVADLAARVADNAVFYMEALPRAFVIDHPWRSVIWAAALFLALFVAAGLVSDLVSRRGAKDFYFLFYCAFLAVWPVSGVVDAMRYLVPVIPLLYWYFIGGSLAVADALKGRFAATRTVRATPFVAAVAAAFLMINVYQSSHLFSPLRAAGKLARSASLLAGELATRRERMGIEDVAVRSPSGALRCYDSYFSLAASLDGLVPADGVILTRKPELVSLLSGRLAVRYPFTRRAELFDDFVERASVTHILVDGCYKGTRRFVYPFLARERRRLELLRSDDSGAALIRLKHRDTAKSVDTNG